MSSEERKKKKEKKAQKLREKQEQHLKKVQEEEQKEKEKSEKDLIPDDVSKKGYKISDQELSSGQFSTIFKATLDDEDIAAKIIEKKDKDEAFTKKLIPRIVRILKALDERHPNIIDILDVFETSKRVIIMMRLTPNGSLYDFVDKSSELLDESQTRKWAQQLISGITYLHINGIVHRDLRTDRIFLDKNNCLKISGLTYSRLWMNPKDNSQALSKTCGTTGPYCSPEAMAGESYDPRTADVWAFGVIVFFIWNKSYPFDYNVMHRLIAQQKSNEWMNRMRKESNEDIKEFFKQIFDTNYSNRKTVIDLIKDKWLDYKVKIIDETNDGERKTETEKSSIKPPEKDNDKTSEEGKEQKPKDKKPTETEVKKTEGIAKTEESKSDAKATKKVEKDNDSDDTDETSIIIEDDDDDIDKSDGKSETKDKKDEEKVEEKVTQEAKEKKSVSKKSGETSAEAPNELKVDILAELKQQFMALEDK